MAIFCTARPKASPSILSLVVGLQKSNLTSKYSISLSSQKVVENITVLFSATMLTRAYKLYIFDSNSFVRSETPSKVLYVQNERTLETVLHLKIRKHSEFCGHYRLTAFCVLQNIILTVNRITS